MGPFLAKLGYRVADLADATGLERRYVRDGRHVVPGNYLVHAVTAQPKQHGRAKARPYKRRV